MGSYHMSAVLHCLDEWTRVHRVTRSIVTIVVSLVSVFVWRWHHPSPTVQWVVIPDRSLTDGEGDDEWDRWDGIEGENDD